MRFVGVDLAWSPRHPTGVAVAAADGRGARLEAWASDLRGHETVAAYVDATVGVGSALLAIDAPLVVPNATSLRPCDRRVNALFRRYHAGVHPASRSTLGRYDGFEGERLRAALQARGYADALPPSRRAPVRAFFETYPHAAAVALFGLEKRLPYKPRGASRPWSVRRAAFRRFQVLLRGLAQADPPLQGTRDLLGRDVDVLAPGERKGYEDLLDALLCAYVALHAWHGGPSATLVLGSVEEGYMVLPRGDRPQP